MKVVTYAMFMEHRATFFYEIFFLKERESTFKAELQPLRNSIQLNSHFDL